MKQSNFDEKELAKALVPLVGRNENIIEVTHCITRLRFILKDEALADMQAIEDLPGVVKVFSSGGPHDADHGRHVPGGKAAEKLVVAGAAAYACFGVYLAYTLFEKDKKQREVGLGALITHALGGITEPGMFSLLFTNGRLMGVQSAAAFFGALYLGIQGVGLYTPGISNFMAVLQFAGGEPANFRNAVIGCGISFVIGFILTMVMQKRKNR